MSLRNYYYHWTQTYLIGGRRPTFFISFPISYEEGKGDLIVGTKKCLNTSIKRYLIYENCFKILKP